MKKREKETSLFPFSLLTIFLFIILKNQTNPQNMRRSANRFAPDFLFLQCLAKSDLRESLLLICYLAFP